MSPTPIAIAVKKEHASVKPLAVAPKPLLIAASQDPQSFPGTPNASSPASINYQLEDAPVSQLSTSKVWVLPPRPKPGRKPSTDTPPTKRKAQNRAAQRAFRERRAARVCELEELLADVQAERDARESKLSDTLKSVFKENSELRRSLDELRNQVKTFTSQQNNSGNRSSESLVNAGSPNEGSPYYQNGSNMQQMASPAPSLESPMDVLDRVLELRLPIPVNTESKNQTETTDVDKKDDDCGICLKDECLCGELGIKPVSISSPAPIADSSMVTSVPLKRRSSETSSVRSTIIKKKFRRINEKEDEMEIDFTAKFSKTAGGGMEVQSTEIHGEISINKPSHSHSHSHSHSRNHSHSVAISPIDKCGFCSDDTPCVCAETAAQEASSLADIDDNTLPPLVMPHFTGDDVTDDNYKDSQGRSSSRSSIGSMVKLPALHPGPSREIPQLMANPASSTAPTSGCSGNPGTCTQCQADPMSTLFCTTLASRKPDSPKQGGCCGGAGAAGGCCKDKAGSAQGTFIPCSAAYQTLSRHKDFGRIDLGTLVGKLNTRGMQVEVSSVANVLRELDRRLYS